jgi:sugar phosphate isomerase/epimerase
MHDFHPGAPAKGHPIRMNRVLSTHVIVNHRLTTAWLNRVADAQVSAVEIFCAPQHLDYRDKSQIAELGHWFRDSELTLHSLHSPMYTDEIWGRSGPQTHINITDLDKSRRIHWVGEIKRAIEIAEVVPFRYLIQHLGVGGQEFSEYAIEAAFGSLEELIIFAGQRGVEILLENTPNELADAEHLQLFNSMTHLNLKYVFDTGHAHIGAGIAHEFAIMKPRIRSLHVHDNDGKEDQHLFPMTEGGSIDWTATMDLLRTCDDPCPLLLELREVPAMQYPLDEIARVFNRLEALQSTHA